ncbi:MAG: hypothetical protein PHD97_13280, partial [Bacteroidales bacterium]|nr:hypothetical protein [Bacteroidales bacterium]
MKKKKLILVLLVLFFSCKKYNDTTWDTEILMPLLNSTLKIDNLIPDSLLKKYPDSSLKIVYENPFYEFAIDSLYKIPDTLKKNKFPQVPIFSAPVKLAPEALIFSQTDKYSFNVSNAKLMKIIVRKGFLKYRITSSINGPMRCDYKIYNASKDGIPFEISEIVPAAPTGGNSELNKYYDISGYTFILTGTTGLEFNSVSTKLSIYTSKDTVLYNPSDTMIVESGFVGIVAEYIKGYMGTETFTVGPSFANVDIFKKITSGTLKVEDIVFTANFKNSFGIDATATIKQLTSVNTRTNKTVALNSSIVGKPINLTRAMENSYGSVSATNTHINIENYAAKPFFENLPDKIGYTIELITDPLGNISGGNDFVYYGKGLKVNLNMEIPLSLIANQLTLTDTAAFNLKIDNLKKSIKSGSFNLIADNGFPFDANVQLLLLNEQNKIVDSLFSSNLIKAAPVDANYIATGIIRTVIVIPMPEAKMSELYETKKIIVRVKFNTNPDNKYLKIYSDYSMKLNLTADLKF